MKQGKGSQSFAKRTHWSQQTPSSNHTRDNSTRGHHHMVNTEIRLIIFFAAKDGEALYIQQKQHPVVDVTGDRSKVQCCKKQYCIGTWDVKSLTLTFQESANENGLEWVNLIQMTIISTTVGKIPQQNGVALIVNKRV